VASGLASAMATPAVNEAHAKAVQSAARRIEGTRERRMAPTREAESRSERAWPAGSVDWANFIEILICVVSTDQTIAAGRDRVPAICRIGSRRQMQQMARSYACEMGASTLMRTIRINIANM
jgi:hypothetical protein